ncbi:V-type ATP synthase subunit K [Entomospira culicis]|uniref:V-type ATP synthase subunit K n=1 Tax=Entomospira culicis TaxID=2719989 RepID=A0A968GIK3_9SPIO|nr:V-type ATP synthase subunit K [Entomospira culicis]NIZ19466.1 V-type ATP synthase subunit K [Entomospira culicis]NIZ69629.1 V-type ATP synthase subunit K [Entomospira culicis]WDI36740.1 V-type ATP synthase subunit K [Entomospira culicis]WDI38369.1 V-type ATP synthase subunit K [Entomospira culicis]
MNDLLFSGFYLAFAIASIGSGIGIGIAAQGAVGAWKKALLSGKRANAAMLILVSFPLSQTFYGMVVMNDLSANVAPHAPALAGTIGLFGGLAIAIAGILQGKVAAYACDALGETGKGFGSYVIVLGIIETVALFAMVFSLGFGKLFS